MTEALRIAVFDALNNADEGGYSDFVRHNSLTLVALDLFDCDADVAALLGDVESDQISDMLAPIITAWRRDKINRCPLCKATVLPDSLYPGSGPVCECGWAPNLDKKP